MIDGWNPDPDLDRNSTPWRIRQRLHPGSFSFVLYGGQKWRHVVHLCYPVKDRCQEREWHPDVCAASSCWAINRIFSSRRNTGAPIRRSHTYRLMSAAGGFGRLIWASGCLFMERRIVIAVLKNGVTAVPPVEQAQCFPQRAVGHFRQGVCACVCVFPHWWVVRLAGAHCHCCLEVVISLINSVFIWVLFWSSVPMWEDDHAGM